MTRQIALGAVIAFTVTVLALSVWEPKAIVAVTPIPAPAPPTMTIQKPLRPMMLRPDTISRAIQQPEMMMQVAADAGSPAP